MRKRREDWKELREHFVNSISTLDADRQFRELRRRSIWLLPFERPEALVAWMNVPGGGLDEKDRALAALVAEAQAHGSCGELAESLIWLALWPGLDHRCYRRFLKHFRTDPEELVAMISAALTTRVRRMNLGRVSRVVATLVRYTHHDVLEGCRKRWRAASRERELPGDSTPKRRSAAYRWAESPFVALQERSERFEREQADAAYARLRRTVGDDADLVFRIGVRGERQAEIARKLGLDPGTVRKRVQRARARGRVGMSHFGVATRVSPPDGARAPQRRRTR